MTKTFQCASLIWWLIIPGAAVFLSLLAHHPEVLPLEKMGDLGDFLEDCSTNYSIWLKLILWSTVLAHVYEALLARRLSQKLRLTSFQTNLWTFQTFVLGYPSLKIIQSYENKRNE